MSRNPRIILTGATGFIGHYLLAELLRRDHRCVALARGPVVRTAVRLAAMLGALSLDTAALTDDKRLVCLQGDLCDEMPHHAWLRGSVLVHAAGATNFQPNAAGDPHRTNVTGTANLLAWAESVGIREFHLLSSAYVCGRARNTVDETIATQAPIFHNDYERSKHDAEKLCAAWAAAPGRELTIYRPSVVVGEFATGRATRFNGFYMLARATEFLDHALRGEPAAARRAVDLRIGARPDDGQNLVPVDYVASIMARVLETPSLRGRVFHVTNPHPPTNAEIKAWLEAHYHLSGGRFIEPDRFPAIDELNEHERVFRDVIRPIEHYFTDTPVFNRSNAEAVERSAEIRCPRFDGGYISRLLVHAHSVNWGRCLTAGESTSAACAAYFERFLPQWVGQSKVARMTGLTTSLRFVIDDVPAGEWICRFRAGRLVNVSRGANGTNDEFAYHTSGDVFWEAIAGRVHPQELFLTGRAEITGDVEKGLKMAMVLHEFTREFPCDRETLARLETGT